ncbi:hypothetical protein ACFFRR_005903 [Megaselia abdita]
MIIETIALLAVIAFLLYKWTMTKANYFVDRNVKYDRFIPIFGSFLDIFLKRKSIIDMIVELHTKFSGEQIAGIFDNNNPAFMIRDPEIIKKITVKEFDHFTNHRSFSDPENGGLFSLSLFTMKSQKWKDMRSTLSPAFTGSKMRLMFDLIREVSDQARKFFLNHKDIENGVELDIKQFFTRFTNDVIASTAFGIKIDSLSDETNEFYQMGKTVTNFTALQNMKFLFVLNFKYLAKVLKIRLFEKKYDDYFIRLVTDAMKYRKENKIVRNDVINILMDAKGMSVSDNGAKPIREWTDEDLVAQCFLFFFAGFETVSTAMSFAAHELMANPDIQKRLIREIEEVKETLNGKPLSYEVLNGMKYLDAVVNETLRKWPGAPVIDRVCNEDYVVEDMDKKKVVIKKDEVVFIPVAGIHYDPEFYPNPKVFDPDRFFENTNDIHEFNYMPFGVGPRKCIANRFALMETKVILFNLLSDFSFRKGEKSVVPMVLDPNGFQIKAKHGCFVKLVQNNTPEHDKWMNL